MRPEAEAALAGKVIAEAIATGGRDSSAALLATLLDVGVTKFEVTIIGDGGESYGTVSMRAGAVTVGVADEAAFLDWVSDRYPTEVVDVPSVRPAFRKRILEEVRARKAAVDADGREIPGVKYSEADPTIVVSPTDTAREAARAALNGQGRPIALPGLTRVDTPEDAAT